MRTRRHERANAQLDLVSSTAGFMGDGFVSRPYVRSKSPTRYRQATHEEWAALLEAVGYSRKELIGLIARAEAEDWGDDEWMLILAEAA